MAQISNASAGAGNGLGPTTHIVTYSDLELAVTQISAIGTVAGIDTASGHIAAQTTATDTVVAALANVTAGVATFS